MDKGYSLNNMCSKVPSSKSERNNDSRDSIDASKAATQIIPGPISARICLSGEIPKGNSVTTITKKNNGFNISLLCLNARRKSRFIKLRNTLNNLYYPDNCIN